MALAALAVAGLAPVDLHGQLAVDQVELFLEPQAGGRRAASFNVLNESDLVVEAAVYLNDWERDESGEHRFLPSGQLRESCGRYLKVFPLSLRLPPHSSQAVRVTLDGADSLRAACWSILFVESGVPQQTPGRQITYITRLGVKVYAVPSGLVRDGEIEQVLVRPRPRARPLPDSSAQELVVAFRNTGGLPLWSRGRVEFRRLDNSVAATLELAEFPVLPGALRRLAVGVPSLPSGRYVALALLDYGGSDIAGGQVQIEVP